MMAMQFSNVVNIYLTEVKGSMNNAKANNAKALADC